eukprot:gb/GFBE01047750.1/.p1 GENE.gb/GFBE01047750.1/~~gb/GFBE01047750.1/.p1  ORF type:complete len:624 (+),score=136.41 gb/GFBE01047750.1/:1-1872(+)
MKARVSALTCLPLLLPLAWTAKIVRTPKAHASQKEGLALLREGLELDEASRTSRDAPACPGNVFPDVELVVDGIAFGDDILPGEPYKELQSNLAGSPDWVIGKQWTLSLTVSSVEHQASREFGFAGGDGGFLKFKVPAGAIDMRINVTDAVKVEADTSRIEYRGKDPITTEHAVTLSNICLRPVTCDWFFDHAPTMCLNDDMWARVPNPSQTVGHTRDHCCEKRMCATEAPCTPETRWSKRPDYDNATGSQHSECCIPIPCKAEVCNSSLWVLKPGDVFGSTTDECCVPADCDTYQCSATSKWSKKLHQYSAAGEKEFMQGSTDEECCLPKPCTEYNCSLTDKWKANASATLGSTYEECCEPLWCENFTCSPATEWVKDPDAILGSTNPSCCKPKLCSAFTCNATHQLRAGAIAGEKDLRGSTHEECCELKFCKDYKCSDPTKWVSKPDMTKNDLERRGSSDEECCDAQWCSNVDCEPDTLWAKKSDEELEGLQGSTPEQCCEVRWCSTHTCTGDYPQLNITSTMWYHKQDTNHYKFRGSTDEECCHPIYCSQFFTKFPTKYERMPENQPKPRQGSTEEECYRPLVCIDHCCVDESLKRKADASSILGSTDEECCENRTEAEI